MNIFRVNNWCANVYYTKEITKGKERYLKGYYVKIRKDLRAYVNLLLL